MSSLLGPVPVRLATDIKDRDGSEAIGLWKPLEREVVVEEKCHPVQQLQTYWHEWAHVVLSDNGVDGELTLVQVERICDAFGTARAREDLDGLAP